MSATAEHLLTLQEDSLPPGWKFATIEGVVGKGGVFIDGDWVESKDQDPEGDVRLIQLADIGDGEYRNKSARFLTYEKAIQLGCTFLQKGDVLIARMPDPLGRACIFPGDSKPAVTVVDVAIVRSANGEFNHRWLMYFVNAPAFRAAVASKQSGSTRKRISRGNLSKISLPVPPPDQQKRIVAEIEKQFSRLDEALANLKRVKANLRRYKAAVLKAAVEGRLVETEAELARREGRSYETGAQLLQRILETRRSQWKGKGKYKEPTAPDTTYLPELPEGWVWASVQQLADVQLGKMLDRQKHRTGKELPYLRNIHVRWGSVDTDDLLMMFFKDSELDRYGLNAGDVLVCEGGEPGRAAVWDGVISGMMYQKAIHRVRFLAGYEQKLLVFLLEYLAKSGRLERWFTGSTIKHFTGESFAQLSIPLPPHDEQRRIVTEAEQRLSIMEGFETQVDANIVRAERLRKSILQQAFSHTQLRNQPHKHAEVTT